jgi:hypothetical protein
MKQFRVGFGKKATQKAGGLSPDLPFGGVGWLGDVWRNCHEY